MPKSTGRFFRKFSTLSEALRNVLNRPRYGRGVINQSVAVETEKSKEQAQIVSDEMERIHADIAANSGPLKRRKGEKVQKSLTQLTHQREILNALMELGNRKVKANEIAAALALVHGTHEDDLRTHLKAMRGLGRKNQGLFEGSADRVNCIVKDNLLHRLVNELDKQSIHYAAGTDLQRKLQSRPDQFNTATGVLDLAGLISKQPVDSTTKSFVWMHPKFDPPEPVWNYQYNLLKEIVKKWKAGKASGPTEFTKKYPNTRAPGSGTYPRPEYLFDELSDFGLIEIQSRKKGGHLYQPSDEAIRFIEETQKTGILHPELRVRLIGQMQIKSRLHLSNPKIQSILEEIKIRMRAHSFPKATHSDHSIAIGVSTRRVAYYLSDKHGTTTGIGKDKLAKLADYFEREGHDKEAAFLRVWKNLPTAAKTQTETRTIR